MDKAEKDRIKSDCYDFIVNHPDYFRHQISTHYPFTEELLSQFGDRLDWYLISSNKAITWTESLMVRFKNELNWWMLSQNPTAFRDIMLLEVLEDEIDWLGDESFCYDSIANNEGLPWSLYFIKKYETRIDFSKLSSNKAVPWSEEIFKSYRDNLNFNELCFNEGVPWNLQLFEKYVSNYKELGFYLNSRIRQDLDLLEKYSKYVDWCFICGDSNLPWKEKNLLERWKEHLYAWGIAQNEALFDMDNVFFNKHLEKWSNNDYALFSPLSSNKALPWSIPFIEAHKEHWDWQRLSQNEGLPWSVELIEHFRNFWVWGCWYDTSLLDENGFEISPTGGKGLQSGLVDNEALPWSIYFINLFSKYIDFELLESNNAVWEKAFKPYLDNQLITEIFALCYI